MDNYAVVKSVMSLRTRLLVGFGSIVAIFFILVVFTIYNIRMTKDYASQVMNVNLPSFDAFIDLNSELDQSELMLLNWHFTADEKYKVILKDLWVSIASTSNALSTLAPSWHNDEYLKYWTAIQASTAQIHELQTRVLNTTDKVEIAKILNLELIPEMVKVRALLNALNNNAAHYGILDMQSEELNKGMQQIGTSLSHLEIFVYVLFAIGLLLAGYIALYTSRSIISHLNRFRAQSSRIASGDLTQFVKIESDDEMGKLGQDLNRMTSGLSNITKQITDSCLNMVSSLDEVRHAVDAQSSGSAEQASSINEITASLSEIEKSSNQTMDKAKSLGEVAERTRESGQQGLLAVEQSVQGMKNVRDKVQMIAQTILELSHQTQQVGEITAVVNNLAQQSKMLALNASIEAAKAGEAGKGFAVVAVEVKNLAEQSEQSTAQVQKILENIRQAAEKAVMVTEEGTKGVDLGTTLVEQTGEIIRTLNDVIHETTIASQQIEAAVRQEGAGIEQITAGMTEINHVTSAFVESSKQTKEAMSNLAEISRSLKGYVDVYKV